MDSPKNDVDLAENQTTNSKKTTRRRRIGCLTLLTFFVGLVALILLAVPAMREDARKAQCSNNQREIVIALHYYYEAHGALPPLHTVDDEGKPLHSWRVLILPYIEQEELYRRIRLDESWDSAHNRQFHDQMPLVYHCPSNPGKGCCYSVVAGQCFIPARATGNIGGLTFDDIPVDHLDHVLAIVEVREPFCWMAPDADATEDEVGRWIKPMADRAVQGNRIGSFHPGGSNATCLNAASLFFPHDPSKEAIPYKGKMLIFPSTPTDAERVDSIRPMAEAGDAEAQFEIGSHYLFGDGVSQNYAEAIKWLHKAAEQGHTKAQYELSVCYRRGESVPQNDAEAVKWCRKSAEQGWHPAQSNLAIYLLNGIGEPKNEEEAITWLHKAAEQESYAAQCILGECYFNGAGVSQNKEEAVRWYRKSAKQGYTGGQYNLGECYLNGEGVQQNLAEAENWLRKAAEQGHEGAANLLQK